MKQPRQPRSNFSLTIHRNLQGDWSCHCIELGIVEEAPTPMLALRKIASAIERASDVRRSA